MEEYDGTGARTARYVYAPGVDQPISIERGANRYFYHFDGSGSVIALTGASGIVSERYTYGPFGESASTSAVGNPYRYTGRELDAETGLYYYRARYYSVALGRFLSPDPLGYQDSMGLYTYVGNDPLNLVDPDGLLAWDTATKAYVVYNNLTSGLLSFVPPLIPQPALNFATGVADAASLGSGPLARGALGFSGGVDVNSDSYSAGQFTSLALGAGPTTQMNLTTL